MVINNTNDIRRVATQKASATSRCFRAGVVAFFVWLCLGVNSFADTPVTPNASPEAQAMLAYLHDIHGKKMLSGQQRGWRGTNELGFELQHIQQLTGKLPAILGLEAAGML